MTGITQPRGMVERDRVTGHDQIRASVKASPSRPWNCWRTSAAGAVSRNTEVTGTRVSRSSWRCGDVTVRPGQGGVEAGLRQPGERQPRGSFEEAVRGEREAEVLAGVRSVLGLDVEGQPVGPGSKNVGGVLVQRAVGGIFLQEPLVSGIAEFPVKLEVFEAVGGDVIAGSAEN